MVSLEKRGRAYRIVFRYAGVKYTRALSTRNEQAAEAALARLVDNLHRLEHDPPDDGDLASFLLSDAVGSAAFPSAPRTVSRRAAFICSHTPAFLQCRK